MKIFSLDRLRNIKLIDIFLPKIVRFIWSAILDEKVCFLCKSLDGKVVDSNSSEYSTYQPPIHPKCRCGWVAIGSDASNIPEPNFEKPDDSWIKKYAPFWFVIPEKEKKKKIVEIIPIELPYISEAPELIFNPNDILSIEEFIRETEERRREDTYEPE